MRGSHLKFAVITAAMLVAGPLVVAQTQTKPPPPTKTPALTEIKLPKNKYTPEQDVQIGMQGAAEIKKQYPIIKDAATT